MAGCKSGREPSAETEGDGTLILDFPDPRTERKLIPIVKGTQSVTFCWGSPSRFIHSHSLECALLEAGCPVCSIPESLAYSKRLLLTPQLQAPRVVGQDKVFMMSWDHSVPGTFVNLWCSPLSPPLSRVHLIMIMETRIYSVLPECQTST